LIFVDQTDVLSKHPLLYEGFTKEIADINILSRLKSIKTMASRKREKSVDTKSDNEDKNKNSPTIGITRRLDEYVVALIMLVLKKYLKLLEKLYGQHKKVSAMYVFEESDNVCSQCPTLCA